MFHITEILVNILANLPENDQIRYKTISHKWYDTIASLSCKIGSIHVLISQGHYLSAYKTLTTPKRSRPGCPLRLHKCLKAAFRTNHHGLIKYILMTYDDNLNAEPFRGTIDEYFLYINENKLRLIVLLARAGYSARFININVAARHNCTELAKLTHWCHNKEQAIVDAARHRNIEIIQIILGEWRWFTVSPDTYETLLTWIPEYVDIFGFRVKPSTGGLSGQFFGRSM